jgi:hypothetical protein
LKRQHSRPPQVSTIVRQFGGLQDNSREWSICLAKPALAMLCPKRCLELSSPNKMLEF